MKQNPKVGIRRKSGWLESPTKPEGVEATEIIHKLASFWRWCDHRSRGRYMALDGGPRCLLCGKKAGDTKGKRNED